MEFALNKHMTLDQLGSYVSDFHKEVYGFRPRYEGLYDRREALEAELKSIQNYMDYTMSTFEGREYLRAEGWVVREPMTVPTQFEMWEANERVRAEEERLALEVARLESKKESILEEVYA